MKEVITTIRHVEIRLLAKLIGCLVTSLPAVMHGALYRKHLETDKISALKSYKGNFDRYMSLSVNAMTELIW